MFAIDYFDLTTSSCRVLFLDSIWDFYINSCLYNFVLYYSYFLTFSNSILHSNWTRQLLPIPDPDDLLFSSEFNFYFRLEFYFFSSETCYYNYFLSYFDKASNFFNKFYLFYRFFCAIESLVLSSLFYDLSFARDV